MLSTPYMPSVSQFDTTHSQPFMAYLRSWPIRTSLAILDMCLFWCSILTDLRISIPTNWKSPPAYLGVSYHFLASDLLLDLHLEPLLDEEAAVVLHPHRRRRRPHLWAHRAWGCRRRCRRRCIHEWLLKSQDYHQFWYCDSNISPNCFRIQKTVQIFLFLYAAPSKNKCQLRFTGLYIPASQQGSGITQPSPPFKPIFISGQRFALRWSRAHMGTVGGRRRRWGAPNFCKN